MTREEAIDIIKCLAWHTRPHEEDVEQAIKTLEREPCDKDINVPATDAISRQAVLDAITANCIWENEYNLTSSRIKKAVEDLPPVTSQPKTGHWIIDTKGIITTLYRCSECNRTVRDDTGYSPYKDYPFCHCGAKMVEGEE